MIHIARGPQYGRPIKSPRPNPVTIPVQREHIGIFVPKIDIVRSGNR